jgi:predicted permease
MQGRYFDNGDNKQSMPVVIVNETMARQYWADEEPIGKRFKLGVSNAPWVTIVGVVADVRQMGMDVPVKAEMYFPYRQITTHFWYSPRDLVIRTQGDPMKLASAVRQEIRAVDADQPVSNIATMEDLLTEETGSRRLGMILLSAYAGLALLLASLGIYGVLSYLVAQQTPEIGVRMALGARPGNILRLVLRKGMIMTLLGIGVGLFAALALTRLMASLLFGVSATDPLTFAAIALLLAAVALLACYLPARRAMRVDPMVALRYE